MGQVRYTSQARTDLLDIWRHIATHSVAVADSYLDRIGIGCTRLGTFPESGPQRIDIAQDARALVIERWLVIYRLESYGVQIVRIVDSARDLSRLALPSR